MESIYGGGVWLRCNLHTHTTVSDGAKTPNEVMALYRAEGYDVLALTDHWKYGMPGAYGAMTVLSGIEYDVAGGDDAATVHIVGVGMERAAEVARGMEPQQVVDAIGAAGGCAILAHPAWSLTRPTLLDRVGGFVGTEVWNSASAFPFTGRPDSTGFLDQASAIGYDLPAMAADDTHWYKTDLFGGSTFLRAADGSRESVVAALRAGRFYASCGPRIHDIRRDGDTFEIDCDDVAAIGFLSDSPWVGDRVFTDTNRAVYTRKPHEHWLRVELVGRDGKKAWATLPR